MAYFVKLYYGYRNYVEEKEEEMSFWCYDYS